MLITDFGFNLICTELNVDMHFEINSLWFFTHFMILTKNKRRLEQSSLLLLKILK
jgi:hypothetical protein